MKNAILFFLILPICLIGNAKPLDQISVSAEAEWLEGIRTAIVNSDSTVHGIKPGPRTLFIYITNKTDQTLRIPTKGFLLSQTTRESHDLVILDMDWVLQRMEGSRKIIIPQSNFAIAEIKKGETASIVNEIPMDWPINEKPLRLNMRIPTEVWKRYELDYFSFTIDIAGTSSHPVDVR